MPRMSMGLRWCLRAGATSGIDLLARGQRAHVFSVARIAIDPKATGRARLEYRPLRWLTIPFQLVVGSPEPVIDAHRKSPGKLQYRSL